MTWKIYAKNNIRKCVKILEKTLKSRNIYIRFINKITLIRKSEDV